jgi:hypothetical protein
MPHIVRYSLREKLLEPIPSYVHEPILMNNQLIQLLYQLSDKSGQGKTY